MSDLTAQLMANVTQAYQDKQQIKIVGANTKKSLGRQTEGEEVCVAQHTGILKYQSVELVLTARAGTPLIEIQQALAAQQQMLSFEPALFNHPVSPHKLSATLGGTLAANISGPSRPWSGSIRDMVLGVKLINGAGELLNFGGQVMKNVAGYDLARAQAGAMGTLGLMTEISLKVLPIPEATSYLSLEIEEAAAIKLMNRLSATPKPINAACWVQQCLHIRLSGAHKSVGQCVNQWANEYGFKIADDDQFWHAIAECQHAVQITEQQLWRFSLNSTTAPLSVSHQGLIDWGGALRWVAGEYDLSEMQNIAECAGGTVSLWRAGDRTAEINHPLPSVMKQLQQRLKRSMDPQNILNPGRLYSYM